MRNNYYLLLLLLSCIYMVSVACSVKNTPSEEVVLKEQVKIAKKTITIPKLPPHILDPIGSLPKVKVEKEDVFQQPQCLNNAVEFWEEVYTSNGTDLVVYNTKTHEILHEEEIRWARRNTVGRYLVGKMSARHNISKHDVKAQVGAAKSFAIGVARAHQYLPAIKAKLRANNMPEDLAFIPLVESSFNLKARSKVGALGAWQIMPRTMRIYVKGLSKHQLYDINIATDVAIKILKHNYELLGSWPLAVNAYHSGLGRLLKATQTLNTTDICTIMSTYDGKGYKSASRNYYAQFLAARNLYKKSLQTQLVNVGNK